MLEPYEWKRSRTVLRRESGSNPADLVDYRPLIEGLGGQVINISATSPNHINAMDMEQGYGDGENPVVLKSEFLLSASRKRKLRTWHWQSNCLRRVV